MKLQGFTFSAEFGWFVCGLATATAVDGVRDSDWFDVAFFGLLAVVLLVLLVRRWRREHPSVTRQ